MIKKYSDVAIGVCIGYYLHKILRATDPIVTSIFDKAVSFFTDIFTYAPELVTSISCTTCLLLIFLLPEKLQRKVNLLSNKYLGFKVYVLPSEKTLMIAYNQGLTWKEYKMKYPRIAANLEVL